MRDVGADHSDDPTPGHGGSGGAASPSCTQTPSDEAESWWVACELVGRLLRKRGSRNAAVEVVLGDHGLNPLLVNLLGAW